jgi:hypothetical protein
VPGELVAQWMLPYEASLVVLERTLESINKLDHHPIVELSYEALRVTLWTHDKGGITELDLAIAEAFDAAVDAVGTGFDDDEDDEEFESDGPIAEVTPISEPAAKRGGMSAPTLDRHEGSAPVVNIALPTSPPPTPPKIGITPPANPITPSSATDPSPTTPRWPENS